MDTIRTFIAIELEETIKEKIFQLEERLKNEIYNVRWVKKENLHITLKFLGNIPSETLEGISKSIEKPVGNEFSFKLEFLGVGSFPKIEKPRVLWVGIGEGENHLIKLNTLIEKELKKFHFIKAEENFSPHLTIGRVKFLKEKEKFIKIISGFNNLGFGYMMIKKITLMKSTLHPEGPVYEPLHFIFLKEKK